MLNYNSKKDLSALALSNTHILKAPGQPQNIPVYATGFLLVLHRSINSLRLRGQTSELIYENNSIASTLRLTPNHTAKEYIYRKKLGIFSSKTTCKHQLLRF